MQFLQASNSQKCMKDSQSQLRYASNVVGAVLPIEEITIAAHQYGMIVLLDAAGSQLAICL